MNCALEVDDVVGDADAGGDAPRVVQVVDRAAGPEADLSLALVIQLHREADHLVALLRQERSGHRGVDAAGHGYDDAHSFGISFSCQLQLQPELRSGLGLKLLADS